MGSIRRILVLKCLRISVLVSTEPWEGYKFDFKEMVYRFELSSKLLFFWRTAFHFILVGIWLLYPIMDKFTWCFFLEFERSTLNLYHRHNFLFICSPFRFHLLLLKVVHGPFKLLLWLTWKVPSTLYHLPQFIIIYSQFNHLHLHFCRLFLVLDAL